MNRAMSVRVRQLTTVLTLLLATNAIAMSAGDACKLKSPLPARLLKSKTTIESSLDPGTEVNVSEMGEGGIVRIDVDGDDAIVQVLDLEAACAGTLKLCTATQALSMYAENRSDTRSWRIKPGAPVVVLKSGATWSYARVGDREGFIKKSAITKGCKFDRGRATTVVKGQDVDHGTPVVERGEGPGVLLVPLLVEDDAPVGVADLLTRSLSERLSRYRPDAALGEFKFKRDAAWAEHVKRAVSEARLAEVDYVLVGRVQKNEEVDAATRPYVLQIAVFDVEARSQIKGVEVKPRSIEDDAREAWQDPVWFKLLSAIKTAPGATMPDPPIEAPPKAPPPPPQASAPPPAKKAEATSNTPWPLILAGASGGFALFAVASGAVALEQLTQAEATPVTDDARVERTRTAVGFAIGADALTVAAVGFGIAAAGAAIATLFSDE